MLQKLLIANRGEIACRIIRTARQMGIHTVAVYSAADANAQHVQLADQSVYIGPAPSSESYLLIDRIIAAAKSTGADAIHPGYGFLSENECFAEACANNKLIFVGPPVAAIAAMGSKSAAKAIMSAACVPLVPGYHGDDQDPARLRAEAQTIGFPVLLKAAYGGGGKGMRVVNNSAEFDAALQSAKREAQAAFSNDKMLLEKYLSNPRHVEIQVFCDQHGNAVYLSERDCSVQRRHQKVIEEAPAPTISECTRKAMGEAALRAAQAIDYQGAGTVEFLLDSDGTFYFMEMNTRLQVEHPVTELITGQDLVQWQLLVASGEPLPLTQEQIQVHGHAFEARIYAEDPANEFLPSTGLLTVLRTPPPSAHVRIDSGVIEGDEVSAYYDPMIAKLIVWGSNRNEALRRLVSALNDFRVAGVHNNIDFLRSIANHPQFQRAELSTSFIERYQHQLVADTSHLHDDYATIAALAELVQSQQCDKAWFANPGLQLNQPAQFSLSLQRDGQPYSVTLTAHGNGWQRLPDQRVWSATWQQDRFRIQCDEQSFFAHVLNAGGDITVMTEAASIRLKRYQVLLELQHEQASGGMLAPMNGTVAAVLVATGDEVSAGQPLLVMEAMKMEYTIRASHAGTVEQVFYQSGDLVSDGAELVRLSVSA
jgi:3-methylcrotonyl-CoA carboxylase alpha subunit